MFACLCHFCSWYESSEVLGEKEDGTFLLRDSADGGFLFSVSFRQGGRTLHARIEPKCGGGSGADASGASTADSVVAYTPGSFFIEPVLSKPLNRNFVFPLQYLAMTVAAGTLTLEEVDRLDYPILLKDYIKRYRYNE